METEHPAPKTTGQKSKEVFFIYFTAMLFAFTGGSITWPIVQEKLADQYQLMDREKSLEYYSLGQALPGILSLNTAILIGRDLAGWPGGFAAAAGCILPAFCGMLLIAFSYSFLDQAPFVRPGIQGIRAASIGIILSNAVGMVKRVKSRFGWCIVLFSFVATLLLHWNVLLVALLCGFVGVLAAVWSSWRRSRKKGA